MDHQIAVERFRQTRCAEITRFQRHAKQDAEREAVIGSVYRWLTMARNDFPELAQRISDDRLRAIAEGVADQFLAA